MCRILNSILAVTAAGGVSGAAIASRAPSIDGVWQAVEVTTTGPGARTITPLQPNLAIITRKHYSHIDIHADGPRPPLSDAEKAALPCAKVRTCPATRRVWSNPGTRFWGPRASGVKLFFDGRLANVLAKELQRARHGLL